MVAAVATPKTEYSSLLRLHSSERIHPRQLKALKQNGICLKLDVHSLLRNTFLLSLLILPHLF